MWFRNWNNHDNPSRSFIENQLLHVNDVWFAFELDFLANRRNDCRSRGMRIAPKIRFRQFDSARCLDACGARDVKWQILRLHEITIVVSIGRFYEIAFGFGLLDVGQTVWMTVRSVFSVNNSQIGGLRVTWRRTTGYGDARARPFYDANGRHHFHLFNMSCRHRMTLASVRPQQLKSNSSKTDPTIWQQSRSHRSQLCVKWNSTQKTYLRQSIVLARYEILFNFFSFFFLRAIVCLCPGCRSVESSASQSSSLTCKKSKRGNKNEYKAILRFSNFDDFIRIAYEIFRIIRMATH